MTQWTDVCAIEDLVANSGVCALVAGKQIAIFSQVDFKGNHTNVRVFATANFDPIGKANVLYRGILGSVSDQVVVASPLYKQRYNLNSGQCLDDESIVIDVYDTQIVDGRVHIKMAA